MKKRFPDRVERKAHEVINRLTGGQHWSRIGGRRLHFSNYIVVFNLPAHYRLVCWFTNGALTRHKTMPHSEYDGYAANTHR
jgi:hypothetical protein